MEIPEKYSLRDFEIVRDLPSGRPRPMYMYYTVDCETDTPLHNIVIGYVDHTNCLQDGRSEESILHRREFPEAPYRRRVRSQLDNVRHAD